MAGIRALLADNIKRLRQKCGITQAELAKKASVTSNYIGMIEQKRQFPTPEILERLAAALNAEIPELFSAYISPTAELEKLHKAILSDLDRAVSAAVNKALQTIYAQPPSFLSTDDTDKDGLHG
jgi:transcriptional regulator with XRE-family HTH domain